MWFNLLSEIAGSLMCILGGVMIGKYPRNWKVIIGWIIALAGMALVFLKSS